MRLTIQKTRNSQRPFALLKKKPGRTGLCENSTQQDGNKRQRGQARSKDQHDCLSH